MRLAEVRRVSFSSDAAVSHPPSPECVFLPGHLICLVMSPCFLLFFLGTSKRMLSQEKIQEIEHSKGRRARWGLWLGLTPTPRASSPVSLWSAEEGTPRSRSRLLAGRKDRGTLGLFPSLQVDRDCSPTLAPRAPCSALSFKPYIGCKLGSV